MKTRGVFPLISQLPPLLGSLAILFLTACATTSSARGNEGPATDSVDVGYGTVDEEHVTGSVATVRGEDVRVVHDRTLADMLARVAGVRVVQLPGGGISVRIRGTSSILGSGEPLYVVDGMVMQSSPGGPPALDPNNIESISVLKDAGSAAIYGSRGANGVILIKTKRGSR